MRDIPSVPLAPADWLGPFLRNMGIGRPQRSFVCGGGPQKAVRKAWNATPLPPLEGGTLPPIQGRPQEQAQDLLFSLIQNHLRGRPWSPSNYSYPPIIMAKTTERSPIFETQIIEALPLAARLASASTVPLQLDIIFFCAHLTSGVVSTTVFETTMVLSGHRVTQNEKWPIITL